jgi:hypothetical protein
MGLKLGLSPWEGTLIEGEISVSYGGEYEDGSLLGYSIVQFRRSKPTSQRCALMMEAVRISETSVSNFMRLYGAIFLNAVIFTYWWCLEQSAEENIGSMGDETKINWRKIHKEKFHNLFTSSNYLRDVKSGSELGKACITYGDNEKCE